MFERMSSIVMEKNLASIGYAELLRVLEDTNQRPMPAAFLGYKGKRLGVDTTEAAQLRLVVYTPATQTSSR
jgi:hypothetical protein